MNRLSYINRKIAGANEALVIKSRQLEKLSITDTLTGIFNRMKIEEILIAEIHRAERSGKPFSLIMLDVDDFKEINDTRGHQVGDEALCSLADLLEHSIRGIDSLGRWGGEEFMIVCPETPEQGALVLAGQLRHSIDSRLLIDDIKVTCSFGVAEYRTGEGETRFLKRVDQAMYKAKDSGRNTVEIAD